MGVEMEKSPGMVLEMARTEMAPGEKSKNRACGGRGEPVVAGSTLPHA
jgi:hypothetical protein